jgi:hypothetical protein
VIGEFGARQLVFCYHQVPYADSANCADRFRSSGGIRVISEIGVRQLLFWYHQVPYAGLASCADWFRAAGESA